MGQKKFDGVDAEPEDVLQATLYAFPFMLGRKLSGKYERTWKFQLFVVAYHDYHQGIVRENISWIKEDYRYYEKTGLLPLYVMRPGCALIKRAYEQEFIERFREKRFGRATAHETYSETEGRVFRREIQKDGGGDEISLYAFSGGK